MAIGSMTHKRLVVFHSMAQCHGLSRTAERMAELQDEETALKEGYHLGRIVYSAAK